MCEVMATFFTFLLFLSYTGLTVSQRETRLKRKENVPDDDFLLPKGSADCPRERNVYVPSCQRKFNAAPLSECWCQCGSPTEKKTFYEPRNSCVKVSVARQDAGCDLLFTDETEDGLLTFFPQRDFHKKAIKLPVSKTCSLYYGEKLYAQYLGCDGAWNEVPWQSLNDSLEVTRGWTTDRLQIRSKAGATVFSNNTGRIFRLAVQCRHQHSNAPMNSSCVMFKVEGTVNCTYPQQSPSRPSATLPTPTVEIINTTPQTISTRSTEKPTTGPPSEATSKSSQNPNVLGDTGTQNSSKKNTFIIAGSVAGGILLIAMILLILWRCNNPKRRDNAHRPINGSISRPISQMGRNSIPFYTEAAHVTPMGRYAMRSNSMGTSMGNNPSDRKGSDGIILGPDLKRGSLYSDYSPTTAPPRPPTGKRSSVNGHVNPGLSLRENIVTMNPLYEGQVVEHKDLAAMNCSDFGVHPGEQIVPDELNDTYDCPEEILNSRSMTTTPVPVYYVVDDPYPDSISNTFSNGGIARGRSDGHVYDEPEVDLSQRPYVVMDNANGVAYIHDEPPRDELLSMRRQSSPSHGILKVASVTPNNQRYHSQADYDDRHMQVI